MLHLRENKVSLCGSNAVSSVRHRTRNTELVSQGRPGDDRMQRDRHCCGQSHHQAPQ